MARSWWQGPRGRRRALDGRRSASPPALIPLAATRLRLRLRTSTRCRASSMRRTRVLRPPTRRWRGPRPDALPARAAPRRGARRPGTEAWPRRLPERPGRAPRRRRARLGQPPPKQLRRRRLPPRRLRRRYRHPPRLRRRRERARPTRRHPRRAAATPTKGTHNRATRLRLRRLRRDAIALRDIRGAVDGRRPRRTRISCKPTGEGRAKRRNKERMSSNPLLARTGRSSGASSGKRSERIGGR